MTNITLSIDDEVYKLMKEYSEIKWSEFVRKCIKNRIKEISKISSLQNNEGILTMLASEEVLRKDWDNKSDEIWDNV
jgi:metal-responsive CopG/Arc/MetJ family transcriptional regulator